MMFLRLSFTLQKYSFFLMFGTFLYKKRKNQLFSSPILNYLVLLLPEI